MKTKAYEGSFSFESPVNMDNGHRVTRLADRARSTMAVHIAESGRGHFEWEIESLELHEAGGLWFEGNELVDYDGVFELPAELLDHLEAQGYDMSYGR